jgi:large subunit ribosomal protein L23
MQALCRVARRLYSTQPPERASSVLPKLAAAARDASTPMAVRERRERKRAHLKPPSDSDLTSSEYSGYRRALAKGELMDKRGRDMSEAEWLDALNERRTRLRGLKVTSKDGEKELQVVGQRIYLPNIIFRMVRNNTPAGKPYNPYEATFRIPMSVTKTDIRSYLSAVYGVKTTYIRTANYFSPLYRKYNGAKTTRSYRTYKRAVVGLVDPFYYPQAMEDMTTEDRKQRMNWLNEKFALDAIKRWRRHELVRTSMSGSKNWRFTGHLRRDKILKAVARNRTRMLREVEDVKEELAEKRSQGLPIFSDSKSRSRLNKRKEGLVTN